MIWLGAVLRFRSLFANHFHADEALFASWARQIAVWRDPLLLLQPVDKPPLLFYLQALAYPLFGPVEWAARLPNFVASLLIIPLVAVFAWRLYGDGLTAVVAAALLALSPLAIQFSATAFTDPLLAFWLVLALIMAVRPAPDVGGRFHPGLCGVAFGLALVTKYQAWLFLPLVIALALLAGWSWRDWRRGLMGVGVVGVVVGMWLLARSGTGSLFGQQVTNAGGLRLAWSWEFWPRLLAWAGLWQVSLGWPVILLVSAAVVILLVSRARTNGSSKTLSQVELVLVLFLWGYAAVHWLFAVPVWDRYVLPVLPLLLLLVARVLVGAGRRLITLSALEPRHRRLAFAVVVLSILLALLGPATAARLGRYPIGGQPTADLGAWLVAQRLQDEPYGTVLYDHWYSWQWRYHLFDTGVYVSWFPQNDALLDDLAVFGNDGSPRFIVLPDSEVAEPTRRAIVAAGYELVAEAITVPQAADLRMALYRIEPRNP